MNTIIHKCMLMILVCAFACMGQAQTVSVKERIITYKQQLQQQVTIQLPAKSKPYSLMYVIYHICKKVQVPFLAKTSKKFAPRLTRYKVKKIRIQDKAKAIIERLISKRKMYYVVSSKGMYVREGAKSGTPKISITAEESKYWQQAIKADCVIGYQEFLRRYPDSQYATEARSRLATLSKDFALWQATLLRGTIADYQNFIAVYPTSQYVEKAKAMIAMLKKRSREKALQKKYEQERLAELETTEEEQSEEPEDKSEIWIRDFAQAKQLAATYKRPILANFTGSDWCAWCKKMDKEIFSRPEFENYAIYNLVCLQIDFPKYKKLDEQQQRHNKQLLRQYGVKSFPTILILSSTGNVLGYTGYVKQGVAAFIEGLQKVVATYKPR